MYNKKTFLIYAAPYLQPQDDILPQSKRGNIIEEEENEVIF